ncbi:MAG: LytR/AlgR family response regulator transcription factor [Candidatus Kapaibacterium sp.]
MVELGEPIRVVIVDDEQPARAIIKEYLADYSTVKIVGEANSGRQGLEIINGENPDLIFLDIQMPGLTGFELLASLTTQPAVIFCTAYDQYAIEAFEVNAVDYLLKPFSRERFRQALSRVLEKGKSFQTEEQVSALIRIWQEREKREKKRFFVESKNRIIPIEVDDILWIEATGDYSQLHTSTASYLCNERLGEIEKKLDRSSFIRIHRSTIIAIKALHSLTPDGDGGYTAHLKEGKKLRVSRSYSRQLKEMML